MALDNREILQRSSCDEEEKEKQGEQQQEQDEEEERSGAIGLSVLACRCTAQRLARILKRVPKLPSPQVSSL